MSGLSLGSDGMRLLAPCLSRMQMLQQLGLNKNNIGDTGVQALCISLPRVTSLVSLNLERNAITSLGCKMLAVAITPLSMLQRLFLCGNNIAARGVRELAPAVVSLSASNLNSSSCVEASSGGGSFEISFEEELMDILQLASIRWKQPSKLKDWRIFVEGATFMLFIQMIAVDTIPQTP
jgi:Ran GTPase-activating protein (RanGAP) involved in mRNA processing and transport